MQSNFENNNTERSENDEENIKNAGSENTGSAVEDDGTPVLDEQDLEENNISLDDAENIDWDDADNTSGNSNGNKNIKDKSTSGGGKDTNNGGKPASGLKGGKGVTTGSKGTSGK